MKEAFILYTPRGDRGLFKQLPLYFLLIGLAGIITMVFYYGLSGVAKRMPSIGRGRGMS